MRNFGVGDQNPDPQDIIGSCDSSQNGENPHTDSLVKCGIKIGLFGVFVVVFIIVLMITFSK